MPPAPPSPPPAAPRPRPKNEGRFALELCPPDLQALAHTSAIHAFGVDLHLVATQDPGRRHKELLSAFAACEEESFDIVVDVLSQALAELLGAQLLVDQGTPYMAEATRAACERMEVEYAPQKEGAPTEKAPNERAFGTVKNALRPLLDLTDRLAQACPALRRPDLARAATTLGPCDLAPSWLFSGPPIAWTLWLFGVARLGATEVRRRVSPWSRVGATAAAGRASPSLLAGARS